MLIFYSYFHSTYYSLFVYTLYIKIVKWNSFLVRNKNKLKKNEKCAFSGYNPIKK